MNNTSKRGWAKKMLELDLKAQSGAIWTDEKSGLKKRKAKPYVINDQDPDLLVPDPVYYHGKPIEYLADFVK